MPSRSPSLSSKPDRLQSALTEQAQHSPPGLLMPCSSSQHIRVSCARITAQHESRQCETKFPSSPTSASLSSAARCRLRGRSWAPSFSRNGLDGSPWQISRTERRMTCWTAWSSRKDYLCPPSLQGSEEERGQSTLAVPSTEGTGSSSSVTAEGIRARTPGSPT